MRGLAGWVLGFGPATSDSIIPAFRQQSRRAMIKVSAGVGRQVRAHVEL
jgi:hypothetical protein